MDRSPWSTARSGALIGVLCLCATACGSSKSAAPPSTTTSPATTAPSSSSSPTQSPNALLGEAGSAATGDIPDNQVFVTFTDPKGGFSMKYPEGWAQTGSAARVAFRDKNNLVRVVVQKGRPATVAGVHADLTALRRRTPSLRSHGVSRLQVGTAPAIKVVYTTESPPNLVTNKRVNLMVDRYYLWHGGRRAVVDLGTPVGVDNVDAYRLIIQSFRWR